MAQTMRFDGAQDNAGRVNDPGVAAAPVATDEEAGGAPARTPANDTRTHAAPAPRAADEMEQAGAPFTFIVLCALIVFVAVALAALFAG